MGRGYKIEDYRLEWSRSLWHRMQLSPESRSLLLVDRGLDN